MIQPAVSNRYSDLSEPGSAAVEIISALQDSGRFPISDGELSIVFVDDTAIANIHQRFMDDPEPTDVITFPSDSDMDFAGEIILSVDHARCRAAELGISLSRELTLYLVHGWLHLAGYDDRKPEDREEMRKAESEALNLLERKNLTDRFCLKV